MRHHASSPPEDPARPAAPPAEPADDAAPSPSNRLPLTLVMLGLVLALGAVALHYGSLDLFASRADADVEPAEEAPLPVVSFNPDGPFTFSGLPLHPDQMYPEVAANVFLVDPNDSTFARQPSSVREFRQMLDLYEKRQGVDDNFTIRVYDNRDGRTLEVFELVGERTKYAEKGWAHWHTVNQRRRAETRRLVRKYARRGIPRANVGVRWGYANQVAEARERELSTLQYEIKLAEQLGLSLLATEIGTVETFNQDRLVSSAGARSRYQMMPDVLRRFDVNRYTLAAGEGTVEVREEHHPLLTIEPAFVFLRGYVNAVGHEIPGISAYHTGPGNIYQVYQAYMQSHAGRNLDNRTVVDAYMWGVTEGFEQVRKKSSFGNHSRAYVLQAYGSLRAQEDELVDPDATLEAERVRLRTGAETTLADLLALLDTHSSRLDWSVVSDVASTYERFRAINPHMALPASDDGAVPARGDVRLTAKAGDAPVQFFLPLGATSLLTRIGAGLLDASATFVFDQNTFSVPPGERTATDEAYDRLVADIAAFGFTNANRTKLQAISSELAELADATPTPFRRRQAEIARIHRQTWGTRAWRDLVGSVATVMGDEAGLPLSEEVASVGTVSAQ